MHKILLLNNSTSTVFYSMLTLDESEYKIRWIVVEWKASIIDAHHTSRSISTPELLSAYSLEE